MKKLEDYVVTIPDFPEPGIMFRDVTSVIQDAEGLQLAIDSLQGLLNGIDFDKYSKAMNNIRKIYKPIRDKYDNKVQWCIAGVPSVKWAKKVFPSLNEDEAVEALWKAILKTSRSLEGDAIKNFESKRFKYGPDTLEEAIDDWEKYYYRK